jgi:hypothetical protein
MRTAVGRAELEAKLQNKDIFHEEWYVCRRVLIVQ